MLFETSIAGTMVPSQGRAEWQPLIDLVSVDLADWFMWMFEVELSDGSRAHAYKHIATRRYFHLTADGRAFAFVGDSRYRVVDPGYAIEAVFAGWEGILPQPSEADLANVARARARWPA